MMLETSVECRERWVDYLKKKEEQLHGLLQIYPKNPHLEHELFNEDGDHPKKGTYHLMVQIDLEIQTITKTNKQTKKGVGDGGGKT